MRKEKHPEERQYGIASALLPGVLLLFQYGQTKGQVPITYLPFMGLALVIAGAAGFWALRLLLRSAAAAWIACGAAWVACFVSLPVSQFFHRYFQGWRYRYTLLVFGFLGCLLLFFLRKGRVFHRKDAGTGAGGAFAVLLTGLLLLMNAVPVAYYYLSQDNGLSVDVELDLGEYLKDSFYVDEAPDKPNVYWIHMDGMLGFDSFEKYYGDSQEELLAELEERGFLVNTEAAFETGHATRIASTALMSPYAYDSWIAPRVKTHEEAMENRNFTIMVCEAFRRNNEMISAFAQGGYQTIAYVPNVPTGMYAFCPITDIYYHQGMTMSYETPVQKEVVNPDLPEEALGMWQEALETKAFLDGFSVLLGKAFFLWIDFSLDKLFVVESAQEAPPAQNWQSRGVEMQEVGPYVALQDSFSEMGPRLTMIMDFSAHYPYLYDEDGAALHTGDNGDPIDYEAQHRYAAKLMMNYVDAILEADPGAVIVLQADHGLHISTEEEFKEAFGEEADKLELWNHVMSAVRIPQDLQTGEEAYTMLTPLNISRYLINTFVGSNYDYLDQ